MMKKFFKIFSLLLVLAFSFSLMGCQQDIEPATDTYTVTFVDYDGTELESITCTVGTECEIESPVNPNNKDNCVFLRWSMFESEFDSIDKDTTIEAIYSLDNTLLTIGDRGIQLYSFFIITGILVALFLGLRECKRIGFDENVLIDGFLWIVPVSILGARLWYVVSESHRFWYGGFFPSLLRTLGFSSGTLDFSTFGLAGLAIHGGFFTAIICAIIYQRSKKFDLYRLLDIVAVGFIIAQAFGRWGNFFNQEAHGGIVGGMTNGVANWSLEQQYDFLRYQIHLPEFIVNNMYITKGFHSLSVEPLTGFYHPTFLYESFFNLIGFGIMLVLRRVKKVHFGELMSFYLIWYGALRVWIETMRTDPLMMNIFGLELRTAIVTSTVMILLGIGLSLVIRKTRKGKTYETVPGYFGYVKPEVVEEEPKK